jgi:L-histidine Nalpha-methyltransferase / hercynylcysteine S-oxide synthase
VRHTRAGASCERRQYIESLLPCRDKTEFISTEMVAATPEIIDLRPSSDIDLRKEIFAGLKENPPMIPTLVLYDEPGLKLFEKITYLDEYYLTNCEIEILKSKSDEIVKRLGLKDGGIVVELGSG